MILTCPKCQAQYKLDPTALGPMGRDVRCVGCSHMWFQIPDTAVQPASQPKAAEAPPVPQQDPSVKSITDALNSILEKDDAAFEAVLSTVAKGGKGESPRASGASVPVPPSVSVGQRKQVARQETGLSVVTYNPLGMGATAFGGMVFLLCSFLTLAAVFAGKTPIVERWPQMALFYKTLGFDVKAPGEGLRLSEITAEKHVDNRTKTLVVEGKMTNMTEHDIVYPALHVLLKNERNAVMKEWDLKPGITQIASGDIVPVLLQLEDVPDEGSTVEVRVKEK